jgi:hypothetical protein
MPFVIEHTDRGYCVYTQGADGEATGDPHGCHPTYQEARQQQKALYANVPEARKTAEKPEPSRQGGDGPQIWLGGAVKALGDGRVGGYLITYGDETTPDQTEFRDFFTADETDYHVDTWPHPMGIYFWHGAHEIFGPTRLGSGQATKDGEGITIEGRLNLKTPAERRLYECAEAGELGWSSGSLPQMVVREPVGKAHKLRSWPLGEASLGPLEVVADRRNVAVALKSIELPEMRFGPPPPRSLRERTERVAGELEDLTAGYRQVLDGEVKIGRVYSMSRYTRLQELHQALGDLIAEGAPRDAAPPEAEPAAAEPPAAIATKDADPGMGDAAETDPVGAGFEDAMLRLRTRALLILGASHATDTA